MRWPITGSWASNTLDSDQRVAQREAERLFGKPWPEIAALLVERIREIDDDAANGG